jgi:hypothetical protein
MNISLFRYRSGRRIPAERTDKCEKIGGRFSNIINQKSTEGIFLNSFCTDLFLFKCRECDVGEVFF